MTRGVDFCQIAFPRLACARRKGPCLHAGEIVNCGESGVPRSRIGFQKITARSELGPEAGQSALAGGLSATSSLRT